jgi:dTDP-4-dehydrorhamnose reductase
MGHALAVAASRPSGWQAIPLTRETLDLADFGAVEKAYREQRPAAMIHCAALSKSPACQADPNRAKLLNVDVTRHLAELARDRPFFFFSTDLVFDGQKGGYTESDAVNPLSVYAETKVAAEQIVLANPRHTVVRTSLNHGASPTGDRAFNEEMRQQWLAGKTLRLFTDEYRCPIGATVTARAVWELLALGANGLFHLAGSERLSRWEIGELLARQHAALNPRLEPTSLTEYRGAPRSPDTSLDCRRIQAQLGFTIPGYRQWLAREDLNSPT